VLDELEETNVADFKGLFIRGPAEITPPDHFREAQNIRYLINGFETRYGTSLSISGTGIRRFFPYKIEGQANRIIYLDLLGRFFDSLFPATPILTVGGAIDFSMVTFNDRAYISPHNRIRGLSGQFVYVYQGDGQAARPAAGERPLGFQLQLAGSAGGTIEPGTHLIAVAYETNSGFITKPGPEQYGVYTGLTAGGTITERSKLVVSNIPIGPSYVTARHVLASKAIQNYNGDQTSAELFFVPNGRIDNNVDTFSGDLSFYDNELQRSANFTLDLLGTIPAVLGLTSFQGSLVGWGAPGEESIVYISRAGEPESIDATEGGIEIDPSEAGGVKNCVEYRSQLMIHKSRRTYAVTNSGEEPSFWEPISVDRGVGTEVFGIAAIMDEEGNTVDKYMMASRKGLLLYQGTFDNNLTAKIDDIWKRITKTAFNTIQVVLDVDSDLIYAAVPLDGATVPNTILFGDCQRGMNGEDIRWSTWTFPYTPNAISIDNDNAGNPVFKIASENNHIYFLDPSVRNDNGIAIPTPTFQFGYVGKSDCAVSLFGGVRLRASGLGVLNLTLLGLDETLSLTPPSLILSSSPGLILQREFDFQNQYATFRFHIGNINEWFRITRVTMYHGALWMEEPT
jgi:hypothetical protein